MAETWVQNITIVNIPNKRDSKPSKIIRTRVEAGEKLEHCSQSPSTHLTMCKIIRIAA